MSTDQPTTNVKLSLEQLQQLEIVETRLGNLNAEIKIATKALIAANNDCSRITKEKDYQQTLLDSILSQIAEKQSLATTLDERNVLVTEELSKLNQEIATKTAAISAKEMAVKERGDLADTKERELEDRELNLSSREKSYEEEAERFEKRVEKINEAING